MLSQILNRMSKNEVCYICNFLQNLIPQNSDSDYLSLNVFFFFLNSDLNILLQFSGVSPNELKLLTNYSSCIIVEQSKAENLYFNLFNFSEAKYNDFEEGVPIDPITFEKVDVDNFTIINERYYSASTAKRIVSLELNDPFTRQTINEDQALEIEKNSAYNQQNYHDLFNPNGSEYDLSISKKLFS